MTENTDMAERFKFLVRLQLQFSTMVVNVLVGLLLILFYFVSGGNIWIRCFLAAAVVYQGWILIRLHRKIRNLACEIGIYLEMLELDQKLAKMRMNLMSRIK